jgi:hypothetical protein
MASLTMDVKFLFLTLEPLPATWTGMMSYYTASFVQQGKSTSHDVVAFKSEACQQSHVWLVHLRICARALMHKSPSFAAPACCWQRARMLLTVVAMTRCAHRFVDCDNDRYTPNGTGCETPLPPNTSGSQCNNYRCLPGWVGAMSSYVKRGMNAFCIYLAHVALATKSTMHVGLCWRSGPQNIHPSRHTPYS